MDAASDALLKVTRKHFKRITQLRTRSAKSHDRQQHYELLALQSIIAFFEENPKYVRPAGHALLIFVQKLMPSSPPPRPDQIPLAVYQHLVAACLGCAQRCYACLEEGARASIRSGASWVGCGPLRAGNPGTYFERCWIKGRPHYEAHYNYRIAADELFGALKRLTKPAAVAGTWPDLDLRSLKLQTLLPDKLKKQIASLEQTVTSLAEESETVIRGAGANR
ncbi:hypothetical protein BC938DRAFT_473315 [Jimgerdemannia flammicorona]|uniref:Uncharacterized protein n=1 Tax=Jimgerdemannia flammicorona TaxID=994334 RepID=A0A433Q4B9_9FUNG|nr:hypothetical protein BC938DRAFT_473315 [Jimgerdemannia flammicorona]